MIPAETFFAEPPDSAPITHGDETRTAGEWKALANRLLSTVPKTPGGVVPLQWGPCFYRKVPGAGYEACVPVQNPMRDYPTLQCA